ncbi:hypothetical protein LSM04_004251 [Trypanosoma melophagium]|uniref:uncharacterized protein n=1 Tax=Trypanosoma melophagium TaxID=715481 RepID=UPI003519E8E3|nr:hypothetical protein LSM04_004251 [Trypanosoma melophagium]
MSNGGTIHAEAPLSAPEGHVTNAKLSGGRIYTGEVSEDCMHGNGTLTTELDEYTGKFYKNLPHGHGVFRASVDPHPSGVQMYDGYWKMGDASRHWATHAAQWESLRWGVCAWDDEWKRHRVICRWWSCVCRPAGEWKETAGTHHICGQSPHVRWGLAAGEAARQRCDGVCEWRSLHWWFCGRAVARCWLHHISLPRR